MARNKNYPFSIFPTALGFFLLLLNLCPSITIAYASQGAPTSNYEIPALGRYAQLGEFYNEVTQSFLGHTMFKDHLPVELINTTDISWTHTKYTKTDAFEEKSQLINVDLDLAMSIVFGLVEIHGSAEYMNEQKSSNHSVAVFMDYQVRTIQESILPLYDSIQGFISKETLQKVRATHVVIGIKHGGDVVVKFEDNNDEKENKEHVTGSLGAVVRALAGLFAAVGSATTSVTPTYKKKDSSLSIKLFGDVLYGSDNPMNFDQVLDFIRKVPSLVQNANHGKGKPMSYVLFPLDRLREKFQINLPPILVTKLDSNVIQELIEITNTIALVHQQASDLVTDFKNNGMCLSRVQMKELLTLQKKFESNANKFKTQVKMMTLNIRAGQVPPERLVKIKDDFLSGDLSPEQVADSLSTQFTPAQEKIRICRSLIERTPHPVEYFSNSRSLTNFHFNHKGKNVFVLYYSLDFINQNETSWLEQSNRFHQLAQSPVNKMAVVDCEFPNANCPTQNIRKVTLAHFKNGRKKGEVTASAIYNFPRGAKIIEIPALGTTMELGSLFSDKTRNFISVSVLDIDTPVLESESAMGIHQTILFPRQSLLAKLKALKIPAELQLSILTGVGNSLESSGSISRYLSEGEAGYSGLVSRVRTMKQSMNISCPTFQNNLNLDRAAESGATHYIQSIFYGGTSIFQIPGQISTAIENLKGDLRSIKTMIMKTFNRDKNESRTTSTAVDEKTLHSNSIITFMSDIPTIDETKMGPGDDITLEVKETIQSFFQSLAGVSEGKGVPVAYLLHPLHFLDDQIDTFETPENSSRPAPTNQVDFLQHFENLQLAEDSLMEFQSNYSSREREMCVSPSINTEISTFTKEFAQNKSLWIERVASALMLETLTPSVFKELSDEAKEKFTTLNVIQKVKQLLQTKFKGQLRKMKMCEGLKSVGVFYLGLREDSSLDEAFRSTDTNQDVYLLFLKEEWTYGPLWIKAFTSFLSLSNQPNHRLYVVDCDGPNQLKLSCDKLKKQEPTILHQWHTHH